MDYVPPEFQLEGEKKRSGWKTGCLVGAIVSGCVIVFILLGGFAGLAGLLAGSEVPDLAVEVVTSASQVGVGDEFTISIILANTGDRNITIDAFALSAPLLNQAQVVSVYPSVNGGGDINRSAYDVNLTIAPNGKETILLTLKANKAGTMQGAVDIETSSGAASRQIRVVVSEMAADTDGEGVNPIMGDVIPYRSVVQIIALVDQDGETVGGWSGSGTVISSDGLILTNAHVVLSDRYLEVVDLIVSITMAEDQSPVPMFYAEVLQANADLDLAVIKVRADIDGGPANFASLGISPVPIGNSDELSLGDPLIIIGYPGIGGDTITLTRGEVSGFTSEAPYGNRAYIKTSATIAGGNSGGLAATPQGEIIGVPTAVGTGDVNDEFVDCRRLVDTNRDGVIDEKDTCVVTGGFINALRPVQLALPMIQAASSGQVAIEKDSVVGTEEDYIVEGDVIFYDSFDNNSNGWGLGALPEGTSEIRGGELLMEVAETNYLIWSKIPGKYEAVVLLVDAEIRRSAGDGEFGFICGYQDNENFTALEISEDGYFIIFKYVSGDYVQLHPWTYSDLVAAGGPFSISAYCGEDRLAIALNDTLLGDIVDPDFRGGQVGVIAGTLDNVPLRVGFDEFFILKP